MIDVRHVESPIGPLTLAANGTRLCLLHFGNDEQAVSAFLRRWYPDEARGTETITAAAAERLSSYFAGETTALDGIDVELKGTHFQRRVWEALRSVPAGTTASYAEIARRIGAPSAVRAVGAANGANPIAIILPCHRVIAAGGKIGGYGGGLRMKRTLLRIEGARLAG